MKRSPSSVSQEPCAILSAKQSRVAAAQWRLRLILLLSILALGVYLLTGVIFGLGRNKGNSMSPYLQPGDIFFIYRRGDYKAGDVVLIRGKERENYIKRIVAIPGDTVDIDDDGHLLINGQERAEPYIYTETIAQSGGHTLTLNANEYYVLGDNRTNSKDSRQWGAVSGTALVGRVLAVIRLKR